MLKINEIFFSIQGEATNTGMPAIFIRLSGCNRYCPWCDSKYHWKYKKMTIKQIINKISKYNCRNILITGGEPFFQNIGGLLQTLDRKNYWIGIETNGDYNFELYKPYVDWITVSPKTKYFNDKGHELKLVYTGQDLKDYENKNFWYYYLQPCSMKNTKEVVELVKKNNKWRLSLQCQKLINIK